MSEWNIVSSDADIAYLLNQYGRFHDSCLVESYFRSGVFVKDKFMYFAEPKQYELRMIFHSQWYPHPLELCFGEVRRFHVVGWEDHYSCELFDCHLSLRNDLVTGRDSNLIVWASYNSFDPKTYLLDNILKEPGDSYVIAGTLKWRFLDDTLK